MSHEALLEGRLAVSPRELGQLLGVKKHVAYRLASEIGVRISRGRIVIPVAVLLRVLAGEVKVANQSQPIVTSGTPSTADEVKAE